MGETNQRTQVQAQLIEIESALETPNLLATGSCIHDFQLFQKDRKREKEFVFTLM